MCAFDGASNVQKAGAILSIHFPRVTCVHGAEHVVSLFFNDVFKLKELSVLVQYHNRLRNYFGSVRHAPSAMFRKHSKDHNKGISLSFIKIAETRMGGNIIALLRLLRLRDPLVATIVSAEFRKLKCWRSFSSLAQNEGLWEYIFKVCRAFYPVMRVLRLADSKIPVMDKLYFYVRMADQMMEKYLPYVELAYKCVVTADFLSILSQEGLAVDANTGSDDDISVEEADEEESDGEEGGEDVEIDDTISVSSEESCEDDGDALAAEFDTLTTKCMAIWNKRRSKLTHDFSRAGYMLSPHPTIVADADKNHSPEDMAAIERLLFKLVLDPSLVGEAKDREKGRLSREFWDAHKNFWNRDGDYNKNFIWMLAEQDDCKPYEWHQRYSNHAPVLCALACHVLSKVSGIGAAERSWKDKKRVTTPARNRTDPERSRKMTSIVGHHCANKARRRRERESRAGRIWNDADFDCLKLSKFGIDVEVLSGAKKAKKVFRAWKERWEDVDTPKRDVIIENKLVAKYGGIKWFDGENDCVVTAHPKQMYWKKERKRKDKSNHTGYYILACADGFDMTKSPEDQDSDLWEFWDRDEEFYNLVAQHYGQHPDDSVDVHECGGAADSDSEAGEN